MTDFSFPTQAQIRRLELAIFEKEVKHTPLRRGGGRNSRSFPNSTPANPRKTSDGRILWVSVWRNPHGSRNRTSLMWKVPNVKGGGDFSEFPDREDFETFETAGKLVVKRYFLEIGRDPIEMAVTPSLLNGLKNAIESSVAYDPPLPRID